MLARVKELTVDGKVPADEAIEEADRQLMASGAPIARVEAPRKNPIQFHIEDLSAASLTAKVEALKATSINKESCVSTVKEIPAQAAVLTPLHVSVPDEIVHAVQTVYGIDLKIELYRHQCKAIEAALAGRDVVVATATSSGKSLLFVVPIFIRLLEQPSRRFLLVFPTKALAQDQLTTIQRIASALSLDPSIVSTYDGDTPFHARSALEQHGRILLVNPDILHCSLLPRHNRLGDLFLNIDTVVLDEVHCYKSAFGAHVSGILSRLERICRRPRFLCCSATIGNPLQFVQSLLPSRSLELIGQHESGAPTSERAFVLWNPKLNTVSSSTHVHAARLLVQCLCWNLKTLVFCQGRKIVELVAQLATEILQEQFEQTQDSRFNVLSRHIRTYRAGYAAHDRRRIEKELFSGQVMAAVATNALELGIDIGALDATIQVGFPGSVSSLWQQCGRAGRRGRSALSILLAYDGPLDAYFFRHPDRLFSSAVEDATVFADNSAIKPMQTLCAAYELPLSASEESSASESMLRQGVLRRDSASGLLKVVPGSYLPLEQQYSSCIPPPHTLVSIRSASKERYRVLLDGCTDHVLDELDPATVFFEVYVGAIFLHMGSEYSIYKLDLTAKEAHARRERRRLRYYTAPRDRKEMLVIELMQTRKLQTASSSASYGRVRVSTNVYGFNKVEKVSTRILDTVDLQLPTMDLTTMALWIDVPAAMRRDVETQGLDAAAGIHGLCHVLQAMVPLRVLCDGKTDLSTVCISPRQPKGNVNRIVLYDNVEGGLGVCARALEHIDALLSAACECLQQCPCDTGCPSCIQSMQCHEYNAALDKPSAVAILLALLSAP